MVKAQGCYPAPNVLHGTEASGERSDSATGRRDQSVTDKKRASVEWGGGKGGAMLWKEARRAGDFSVGARVLDLSPPRGLSVLQSWMHFSALCSWSLKSEIRNKREALPGSFLFRRRSQLNRYCVTCHSLSPGATYIMRPPCWFCLPGTLTFRSQAVGPGLVTHREPQRCQACCSPSIASSPNTLFTEDSTLSDVSLWACRASAFCLLEAILPCHMQDL